MDDPSCATLLPSIYIVIAIKYGVYLPLNWSSCRNPKSARDQHKGDKHSKPKESTVTELMKHQSCSKILGYLHVLGLISRDIRIYCPYKKFLPQNLAYWYPLNWIFFSKRPSPQSNNHHLYWKSKIKLEA